MLDFQSLSPGRYTIHPLLAFNPSARVNSKPGHLAHLIILNSFAQGLDGVASISAPSEGHNMASVK